MPCSRKSGNKVRGGGFGKALMKRKVNSTIEHTRPDSKRVLTIGEEEKVVSVSDFISSDVAISTLETSSLDDYLTTSLMTINNKSAEARLVIRRTDGTLLDAENCKVISKRRSTLGDAKTAFSTALRVPERPVRFRDPAQRILHFATYVGSFIQYFKDNKEFALLSRDFLQNRFHPKEDEPRSCGHESGCHDNVASSDEEDASYHSDCSHSDENGSCDDGCACVDSDLTDLSDASEEGREASMEELPPYLIAVHKVDLVNLKEAAQNIAACSDLHLYESAVYNYFALDRSNYGPFASAADIAFLDQLAFCEWRKYLREIEGNVDDFEEDKEASIVVTPYEKNLLYWRELWFTIQRSDVVLQVLDARCPLLFYNQKLDDYIKSEGKEPVTLVNKTDYLSSQQRELWKAHFEASGIESYFYSSLRELDRMHLTPREGMMGENIPVSVAVNDDWTNILDVDELIGMLESKASVIRKKKQTAIDNGRKISHVLAVKHEGWYKESGDSLLRLFACITETLKYDLYEVGSRIIEPFKLPKRMDPVAFMLGNITEVEAGRTTIGTIGFPNVGKSSIINSLLKGSAHCQTSRTPGKTRHIQTHVLENTQLTLCDCPGLVLPTTVSTKAELAIHGVINVNTYRGTLLEPIRCILLRAWDQIAEVYNVRERVAAQASDHGVPVHEMPLNFLSTLAEVRGIYKSGKGGIPDIEHVARQLIIHYIDGKLFSYCEISPNAEEDAWVKEEANKWSSRKVEYFALKNARNSGDAIQKGARKPKPRNNVRLAEKL